MTTEIPHDLVPFVERMVAGKRFLTTSDVMEAGLRLLQSQEALREQVANGFEQLDAGDGHSDDQVYTRAERAIRGIQERCVSA